MLRLSHLLVEAGIPSETTIVMRHRPWEQKFRRVFSSVVRNRPDLLDAYQRTQTMQAESAMARASHLVSCIGERSKEATLIGLFRIAGFQAVDQRTQLLLPENQELASLGTNWDETRPSQILRFNLVRMSEFAEYEFRLVLSWPGLERSWYRWADRNVFPIARILDYSDTDPEMPDWRELVLSVAELKMLPRTWESKLREWRGIYLITDVSTGKKYVGSAYGAENILGRWRNYRATGDGGNKLLRDLEPSNLRFSILERLSPDLSANEVVAAENGWKIRLSTREFGLNSN